MMPKQRLMRNCAPPVPPEDGLSYLTLCFTTLMCTYPEKEILSEARARLKTDIPFEKKAAPGSVLTLCSLENKCKRDEEEAERKKQ